MNKYIVAAILASSFFFFCNAQQTLQVGQSIQKKLWKNENHSYSINLKKGEYANLVVLQKGVDVAVDVNDPSGKKLKTFDSPNGSNGPEAVSIEAMLPGTYQLHIYPLIESGMPDSITAIVREQNQGDYEINSLTILSASAYQEKVAQQKIELRSTISWLTQNAHQLKSVKAGSGFEDLQWLKPVLKDVRYVGLGEASHGSREFFQMKHRMLEFLVKEMGFTVFAIEASFEGSKNINDYVLYGKGDAHLALTSQGFWTWDTEEVIDMIEWMRNYNKSVTENKKIKFYGFDMQAHAISGGIDTIKNFLTRVDPTIAKSKDSLFRALLKTGIGSKNDLSDIILAMAMRKGHYVQRSSIKEYDLAYEYAVNVYQFLDGYTIKSDDSRKSEREWRDYYMASNFKNFVAQEKPGTKFVLWAHNAHIDKNADFNVNGGTHPFGSYLKEAYGDAYYAMGFAFSKGGFQAYETKNAKQKGVHEFIIKDAKENSFDWFFAQTKKERFILNFRKKNLPAYMNDFVSTEMMARTYGAVADRDLYNEDYFTPVTIKKDFDAIIFIDNTTRARPTKTGIR